MNIKIKFVLASLLSLASLLLVICGACWPKEALPPAKETIYQELIAEGFSKLEVTVYADRAVIRYQPSFASEKELLKEWIYIMGTAVEEAPWIDKVVIKCLRETYYGSEEIMEVSAKTHDIVAYLTGKTTADVFLPKLVARPIGEGPLITPPEKKPLLVVPTPIPWRDDFDSPSLDPGWSWVREDPTHWSLTDRPGYLRITIQHGDLWGGYNDAKNLLLRPAPSGDFEVTTRVETEPTTNWQQAGLLIYQDDNHHFRLNRSYIDGGAVDFLKEERWSPAAGPHYTVCDFTTTYLKIVKRGTAYTGYYSANGSTWIEVGKYTDVDFTNLKIGLAAFNSEANVPEIPADFDYLSVSPVGLPLISQWAAEATASSAYYFPAKLAIGEPDTFKCGGSLTAWAPSSGGAGPEWLELTFDTPVHATKLLVHETFNAGFVYRVDLIDTKGESHTVWEGKDTSSCPGWFEITFDRTPYLVQSVTLHTQIDGYEAVDAVALTGEP